MRRTALRSVASSSITRTRAAAGVIPRWLRSRPAARTGRCARPRGRPGPGSSRWAGPAARDEARAVTDEEVPHVVRAVVAVHDRGARVVAHAAGAEEMGRERRLLARPAA